MREKGPAQLKDVFNFYFSTNFKSLSFHIDADIQIMKWMMSYFKNTGIVAC